MSIVADILDQAADLIAQPDAWTQGVSARDAEGAPVHPLSPDATCYCMVGAIAKVEEASTFKGGYQALANALEYVRTRGFLSLSIFNDQPERTQVEAVQFLRDAAKEARRKDG